MQAFRLCVLSELIERMLSPTACSFYFFVFCEPHQLVLREREIASWKAFSPFYSRLWHLVHFLLLPCMPKCYPPCPKQCGWELLFSINPPITLGGCNVQISYNCRGNLLLRDLPGLESNWKLSKCLNEGLCIKKADPCTNTWLNC